VSRLDDFLVEDVYVLDTETTGLKGAPEDAIVDIGICRVDLEAGTVDTVYSSVVGHDVSLWNEYRRTAWIFENTDLTLEMVASAKPQGEVAAEVRSILSGKNVTSFNTEYDLGRFLYLPPWSLRGVFTECTDIMKAATPVCRLPSQYYGREYRYPRLDTAYAMIVEGDPAGINGVQDHRALSDAKVASHIMISLRRRGLYSLR
jgi:DNA polymerase-3 subunit epsilon